MATPRWMSSTCSPRCSAQEGGLAPRLLERAGVQMPALAQALESELARRPSVSRGGAGAEAGKVLVTGRLQRLLVAAADEAKRLKDEYVSVEHLLLALVDERPAGFVRPDPAAARPRARPPARGAHRRCAATSA